MNNIDAIFFAIGFAGGLYLIIVSMGRKFPPKKWHGSEEVAWAGRIVVFLSLLLLPTLFGASLSQVREWLEDIWTTGAGGGTG